MHHGGDEGHPDDERVYEHPDRQTHADRLDLYVTIGDERREHVSMMIAAAVTTFADPWNPAWTAVRAFLPWTCSSRIRETRNTW
ncbi:hypothetical protein GCM10010489_37080 [Microbacterium saperdae]|nr:hypothetical protein GCM10010489_37080 [Microbacterium saperdae]